MFDTLGIEIALNIVKINKPTNIGGMARTKNFELLTHNRPRATWEMKQ